MLSSCRVPDITQGQSFNLKRVNISFQRATLKGNNKIPNYHSKSKVNLKTAYKNKKHSPLHNIKYKRRFKEEVPVIFYNNMVNAYSLVLQNGKVNKIVKDISMSLFDCHESRNLRLKVSTPRTTPSKGLLTGKM